jgi:magnesium transporter
VGETLAMLRTSGQEPDNLSYLYIVNPEKVLLGVVDLRDLVVAPDHAALSEIMGAPVVAAEEDDLRDDLVELFGKYHYRIIPVVDTQDHLLGIIKFKDIMKGLVTRVKA